MNYKISVLLLISLLLIAACGPAKQAPTKGAFLGGTSGLIASFEPFSVQENGVFAVFDSEDFPIDVDLKNKGEETVAPGKVKLKLLGPAKDDFQNVPAWELMNKKEIEKISEFNPDGGDEVVSFTPTRAKFKSKVTGFTDVTWNLEYAYDYKTYLIINDVCFKGDITDSKVCDVKGARTFSVSGAPITVNAISEDVGGKGVVLLKIDLRNAGKGSSTKIGSAFDNRFDLLAFSIDEPEKWECKSGGRENEARLISGNAQIICRLKTPLDVNDLFVKNLRLTLQYTYKDLVKEKLRIKESVK